MEDDLSISEMINSYLTNEGFHVIHASDGQEALKLFYQHRFDIILLDLMLPKINGIDCLKEMREQSIVPVLILSAKDSDVDKALGLGFGADDYIAKPFSMIELLARVKAALRRASYIKKEETEGKSLVKIHQLTIDMDKFLIRKNNIDIQLTSKEWKILKLLISYPTKVFTKEQIYRAVWNEEYYGDANTINVHMRRLREKIEDNPSDPKYIKTIWGIGYRLGEF